LTFQRRSPCHPEHSSESQRNWRPILNFAPRGKLGVNFVPCSTLGAKFTLRDEVRPCGPGVNLRMGLFWFLIIFSPLFCSPSFEFFLTYLPYFCKPGANPTIVSHNATNSLPRFLN
jgi:hypothetical protein